MWGAVLTGDYTSSAPTGWSQSGTQKTGYYQLGATNDYIQTPAFSVAAYGTITVKIKSYVTGTSKSSTCSLIGLDKDGKAVETQSVTCSSTNMTSSYPTTTWTLTNSSNNIKKVKFVYTKATSSNMRVTEFKVIFPTTVTLDKNGGSANGSVRINHDETAYVTSTFSAATYDASHTCTGYYTSGDGGTKVLNYDGSFAGSSVTESTTTYISSDKWAYEGETLTLYAHWESAGTSVSLSKAATSNGSFVLSSSNTGTPEINSVSTAGGTGTVYVKGTPNTGYYVSSVTQSGASAAPTITEVSENNWTIVYGSGTTGTSTITVTFSPIWALKGSFDSWGDGYLMSGTGTVSVTRTLTANTRYEFKIYNKGTAYGNTGAIVHSVSGWTFATDKDNCILYTGPAGSYTFSINTSTKAASVTYPSVDHPNANYVYIKKGAGWSDARIYNYQSGSDSKMSDWGGSPILASCEICDETYYYGAAYFNKIIFRDGGSNQSNEMSLDRGKWLDETTHADSWSTFVKYTISYDKGSGSGTTMDSETDICPGGEQALSTNTYTKDHYHFTGWVANRDVTINSATVTQGTLITGTPTIENIQHDIELTAQWEADSYTVTATLTNLTPNSAFPSSITYTGSSTTALDRTLNAATGYNLPANITVTMGGSTLTKDTHYTYNSTNGTFTFTATITGAIVITAAGVAKTYSNTLDREGGTTGSTTVTTTYNSSTLTGYTAPTRPGYTFGGYWSADNGTGTEVIGTNGALKTSVTVSEVAWTDASGNWVKDGAVTLYAKWTPITYTVAFDKNNASATGTMSNQTGFTYGVGKALSTCTFEIPASTHKYFAGWSKSSGASEPTYTDGQSVTDLTTTNSATVTLYAVWKDHTFTNYRTLCADLYDIVLDDGLAATTNNGSAKVANNGTTLTSIEAPTKSGYDVDYYCTNSGLGTQIATAAGALSASISTWTDENSKWIFGDGATFYTKWKVHNYTITYEGLEGASNTNPTSYNIETTTFALADPGSRTGYTFNGWTCGGDDITQIALGTTGDKTITANWTLNHHTVAVSAADHVVITATPTGGSAIAESGSNTNVDYNKTITLNCTPDEHWNLVWDVYKTGESSTKVAVTGSGDGATFTMPDYNVTVTAVMTEDTYHTATFKNNGEVIDGYDGVKTYDGTRPSAPTLTDVTDACDKTDCNKFYGWIAEGAIWPKTINSVAGKTIYRRAADIPVVSGADVVYHAVWAKGTAAPEIPNTLIAKWDKPDWGTSGITGTKADGTASTVTLTASANASTSNNYGYGMSDMGSSNLVITISGLSFTGYSSGAISFYSKASQGRTITVEESSGGAYSTVNTTSYDGVHVMSGISNTTTSLRITYPTGATHGSFYFGTIRIFGVNTGTSYTFTKLTSENTAGWATNNWDGYYIIANGTAASSSALNGAGIDGDHATTVTVADETTITITDPSIAFKITYEGTNQYSIQGIGCRDYVNTSGKPVMMSYSEVDYYSIAYNTLTASAGNYLKWNTGSSRFGVYTGETAPTLYKILESFTEFRVTCCDKEITIGTPTKTGSGSVTFESDDEEVAVGGTVETCEGATEITATVTPTNGYQCTALAFSRADGEDIVIDVDPATAVPFTAATDFTLTVERNANTTLNTTVTFTALTDHYIDKMHYNSTADKSGNYGTVPTLSSETKGSECTGLHYKFIGWIPEADMNMTTGVPTTTANMVAGGATGKYATGTNYYAVWAEEE